MLKRIEYYKKSIDVFVPSILVSLLLFLLVLFGIAVSCGSIQTTVPVEASTVKIIVYCIFSSWAFIGAVIYESLSNAFEKGEAVFSFLEKILLSMLWPLTSLVFLVGHMADKLKK